MLTRIRWLLESNRTLLSDQQLYIISGILLEGKKNIKLFLQADSANLPPTRRQSRYRTLLDLPEKPVELHSDMPKATYLEVSFECIEYMLAFLHYAEPSLQTPASGLLCNMLLEGILEIIEDKIDNVES
jgi:hypothetical protein